MTAKDQTLKPELFSDPDEFYTAAVNVHQPLPEEHPFYHSIGRFAAEAAHLEHALDLIIWDLAGIEHVKGACVTSALMGLGGRFEAIRNLTKYLGLPTQLVERIDELQKKSNHSLQYRNRIVHDAWYVEQGTGRPSQFRTMPTRPEQMKGQYGMTIIDESDFEKKLAKIQKRKDEAYVPRTDLLKARDAMVR